MAVAEASRVGKPSHTALTAVVIITEIRYGVSHDYLRIVSDNFVRDAPITGKVQWRQIKISEIGSG